MTEEEFDVIQLGPGSFFYQDPAPSRSFHLASVGTPLLALRLVDRKAPIVGMVQDLMPDAKVVRIKAQWTVE